MDRQQPKNCQHMPLHVKWKSMALPLEKKIDQVKKKQLGCILEVAVEYLKELYKKHNGLSFLA